MFLDELIERMNDKTFITIISYHTKKFIDDGYKDDILDNELIQNSYVNQIDTLGRNHIRVQVSQ